MRILVANAGSSSTKLSVLDDNDDIVGKQELDAIDEAGEAAVAEAVQELQADGAIDAVAHRIVHGGTRFVEPVRVDDEVRAALEELTDLAPLHQPKSLALLAAVDKAAPDLPAIACFDTAFHHGMPARAHTYAIPAGWRERWQIRKYGFHGLSHAYAARRAAELTGRDIAGLRTISCHIGAGASITAIVDGASVDTTMGFTPLDGLVMATRSGAVDPGLVLWLEEHEGLAAHEIAHALEHESGLRGLAGTSDLREVLEDADPEDATAELAADVYVHRLATSIASMAAAADGIDVLLFTGGAGTASSALRERVAQRLSWLGIELDAAANDDSGDRLISAPGAPVHTAVITAREDIQMAGETRRVLS